MNHFLCPFRFVVLVVCLCAIAVPAAIARADDPPSPAENGDANFKRLDANEDKKLSRAEYLKRGGKQAVLDRDFKLFDTDNNQSLSRSEFLAIPGTGRRGERGEIHDPFEDILERAIEAMDEAYDGWNLRPAEKMNSTFFAINFSASLASDNRRRLDREIVSQADANGDHLVSREEAKRFLEIQLGIRWTTGERLRLRNGKVVNFARFLRMDVNGDNVITKAEFMANWWNPKAAEEDFNGLDRAGDGKVTMSEFARPDGPNLVDPITTFRKADTNLDGSLDSDELAAATPEYRQNLVPTTLPGFDGDGDGKLSLDEYRLSMLGSFNYPWQTIPKDENHDDRLSLDEFTFSKQRDLFQLQRLFYFHRYDKDGDKHLSMSEFEFKVKKLHSIVLVSIESGELREIYRRREFPTCGSPDVSPDGKWIAFDAIPIEGISKARVLKMTVDGLNVHNLCDGLMPSWSPDGKQFACSRYEGGSGVWIMNADGSADLRIADGWAAQWSPDGKTIAYTSDNSLRAYDIESGTTRVVLPSGTHPYQYIFWNMAWSPDSKRLVFKGRLPTKQEIAIVEMTGEPNLKRYQSSDRQIAGDLAWSPDGTRIMFSMLTAENDRSLMYQFTPDSDDPPKLVDGVSTDRAWATGCFSPDGKWLVLSSSN